MEKSKLVAGNTIFQAEKPEAYMRVGSKVATDFIDREKKIIRTVTAIRNSGASNCSSGILVCADNGKKGTEINGMDNKGIDAAWFTVIEF